MKAFGIVKQLSLNQITANRALGTDDVGQGADCLSTISNRASSASNSIDTGIDLAQGCGNRLELGDLG